MFRRILLLFSLSSILFIGTQGYKFKSYNLNKYSTTYYEHDCLHTNRTKILIPQDITICYRHKSVSTHAATWSTYFLGNLTEDWSQVEKGFDFSIWPSGPWVGLRSNGTTIWVGMGEGDGFELLAWRHTCLSISFIDGHSLLYENGKLQYEDIFEEYVLFRDNMPFSVNMISLGCAYGLYKDSDVGVITDFQIFGRILPRQDMEEWTGCKQRLYGDIVSWDSEDWFFNKTENISEVEYLEFDNNICQARNYSNHVFPLSVTFQKALKLCEKVSGKVFQ
jgi:hypothetical protein